MRRYLAERDSRADFAPVASSRVRLADVNRPVQPRRAHVQTVRLPAQLPV